MIDGVIMLIVDLNADSAKIVDNDLCRWHVPDTTVTRKMAPPLTTATPKPRRKRVGNMVALQGRDIILAPLKSLAGIVRQVPLDSQLIRTAESIGVCLGR